MTVDQHHAEMYSLDDARERRQQAAAEVDRVLEAKNGFAQDAVPSMYGEQTTAKPEQSPETDTDVIVAHAAQGNLAPVLDFQNRLQAALQAAQATSLPPQDGVSRAA